MRRHENIILGTLAVLALAGSASAETIVGLTTASSLVLFDSAAPGTLLGGPTAITGLTVGDSMVAIDVRPVTGVLYGLAVNGPTAHLYTLNPTTAAATRLGGDIALPESGGAAGAETSFGFDFNPVVDRIRVVANNKDNFRLNPNNGSVAGIDTALNPGTPVVAGAAYDRSFVGTAKSTLYLIDAATNQLMIQGGLDGTPSPNGGVLTPVGSLGVVTTADVGFDISPAGIAYASLTVSGTSGLYTIALGTGAATLVGGIGPSPMQLRDIAVLFAPPIPSHPMVALTPSNSLLRFDAANPGVVTATLPVTGLLAGDALMAIDVRHSNGLVYAIGVNGAVLHLYAINGTTGAGVQLGGDIALPESVGVVGPGTAFDVDFNTVVDRLRVAVNDGDSFRLNPSNGALAGADTALNPGTPDVVAVAYDRNLVGASATTLFGIDASSDQLVRIGDVDGAPFSANSGIVATIGGLGVDTSDEAGLDIAPDGVAFASLTVGGISRLYLVKLTTGAVTLIGPVGSGLAIRDIAVEINPAGGPCDPDAAAPTLTSPAATTVTQSLCV